MQASSLEINILRLVVALALVAQTGFAQQKLLIEREAKGKTKTVTIRLHDEVFLNLNDGKTEVHGLLFEIRDSSIVVGDEEVYLSEIAAINGVTLMNWIWMGGGAVVIGVGYLWGAAGALFTLTGIDRNDPIYLWGGILDMGVGAGIRAVGALPFMWRSRRYRMANGWRIRIVPR